MSITPSKIAALVLVLFYTLIAIITIGTTAVFGVLLLLVPPLALIWYSEELSEFTGYIGRGTTIHQTSPEFLIAAFGWLVLLGLPIFAYLQR